MKGAKLTIKEPVSYAEKLSLSSYIIAENGIKLLLYLVVLRFEVSYVQETVSDVVFVNVVLHHAVSLHPNLVDIELLHMNNFIDSPF